LAKGPQLRSDEAVGTKIVADCEASFGAKPNVIKSGAYNFFAGSRSDAFFFDLDGIKNLFDASGNISTASLRGQASIRTPGRTCFRL